MPRLTSLLAVAILMPLAVGCTEMAGLSHLKWPFSDQEEVAVENAKAAIRGEEGHSKYVGDYISVRRGLQMFIIEGVGLVTGLAGTGSDDGPPYRELMLDDMRRRRFPRPEEFLRSPDTCIVEVRAFVPPLVRPGDRLDVEVRIPDGSGTKSLRGGMLLECELTEVAFAQGRGRMEGRVLAKAKGPLLSHKLADEESNANILQARIPGGALYVGEDRDLSVAVREEYANYRMSTRIAQRIGERFFDYDKHGIQEPMAEAKTHHRIDIKVHSRYRDNYPRYLQVVRAITIRDTSVEKNIRMQELLRHLRVGPTAAQAAVRLEAVGREAIPYLKSGLESDNLESRFYAAEALAYMGETSGVKVLREVADKEPAFRVFALAALSATDSREALIELQPLFSHDSIETKYGAFRAYANIDPRDPVIAPLEINSDYNLHVIDSQATPVVHVTKFRQPEVVVFGSQQVLKTPVVLRGGRHVLIRSTPTGDQLIVTQIRPGEREQRMEISTRLVDLLLAVDKFGASYPDVVQMLIEADRQGNLAGGLGIDELPRTGRVYSRPGTVAGAAQETKAASEAPNLFDGTDHSETAIEGPIDQEEPPLPANDEFPPLARNDSLQE
ncbi:MAG: flagellar basal body P-ring protein FlgI [Planctomycetaceae bacterium]